MTSRTNLIATTVTLVATDPAVRSAIQAALPDTDIRRYERVGQAAAEGATVNATLILLDAAAAITAASLDGLDHPNVALVVVGEPTDEMWTLAGLARVRRVLTMPEAAPWLAAQVLNPAGQKGQPR